MTIELVLDAPGARLVVSAVDGGRMCSLVVRDQELLVPTGGGTLDPSASGTQSTELSRAFLRVGPI